MHPSKRKGDNFEREVKEFHRQLGVPCERTYLASQAGRNDPGDLKIGEQIRGECKARKSGSGFAVLERWMGDNDILFLRRDRKEMLVCMNADLYGTMMRLWKGDPIGENSGVHSTEG